MEIKAPKAPASFRDLKAPQSVQFDQMIEDIMARVRESTRLAAFASLSVGNGPNAMRVDRSGMWFGAESFVNAPFSVDLDGNVTLHSIIAIDGVDTSDETDAKIAISKELIELAVSQTYASQDLVAALQVQADRVEVTVGRVGGTNLLKNSVGLKTTIAEWQVFDEDGVLVDARNTGTVDQSQEVKEHTEGKSAIVLSNQFIEQTPETITDEYYSFYCRYKKTSTLMLSITGETDIEITEDSYVSGSWTSFKVMVKIKQATTTVRIENTSGSATISDLVFKKGEVSGWQPAPNEVYGKGFRMDKDGFRITDANNTFVSQQDEQSYKIADISQGDIGSGNEIIMQEVNKDFVSVNRAIIQTRGTFQRYGNPSRALVIVPVDDGVFFTLND